MDAKVTEAALARAVPLVKALENKGVNRWAALRIAADCMPAIDRIAQTVTDIEFAADTRLSTNEVLALIVECLKAPERDGGEHRAATPTVDMELVAKLVTQTSDLELSRRVRNCLNVSGITSVLEILLWRRLSDGLLDLDGFGKKSLEEVVKALGRKGLALDTRLDVAVIAVARDEIARREGTALQRTTADPR